MPVSEVSGLTYTYPGNTLRLVCICLTAHMKGILRGCLFYVLCRYRFLTSTIFMPCFLVPSFLVSSSGKDSTSCPNFLNP